MTMSLNTEKKEKTKKMQKERKGILTDWRNKGYIFSDLVNGKGKRTVLRRKASKARNNSNYEAPKEKLKTSEK